MKKNVFCYLFIVFLVIWTGIFIGGCSDPLNIKEASINKEENADAVNRADTTLVVSGYRIDYWRIWVGWKPYSGNVSVSRLYEKIYVIGILVKNRLIGTYSGSDYKNVNLIRKWDAVTKYKYEVENSYCSPTRCYTVTGQTHKIQ